MATPTLTVWVGSPGLRWTAHRRKDCSFLAKSTPVEIEVEPRHFSDAWVYYVYRNKKGRLRRRLMRMCSRCG